MATVESVAEWIARALQPLVYASQSDDDLIEFVARLGWTLPTAPPSLRALGDRLARVYESLSEVGAVRLRVDSGEAQPSELESVLRTLTLNVLLVASDLHALEGRLREELPADYVAATGIDKDLERRAYEWLLSTDLAHESAVAYRLLRVLGVIEVTEEPEEPARHQPSFLRYRIGWDRLLSLLRGQAAAMHEIYGWGTPTIDGDRLFAELVPLSFALGVPAELRYPEPEFTQTVAPGAREPETGPTPQLWIPVVRTDDSALLIAVFVVPTASPLENQGLAITLLPSGTLDEEVPLGDGLGLKLDAAAEIGTGAALVLGPGRDPRVILDVGGAATPFVSGRVAAWILRHPPAWGAKTGVAEPGGTRIQAAAFSLGIGAEAMVDTDVEIFVELRIDEGRIAIVPPDDDGLLSELLPAEGVAAPFSLAVRWSRQGLRFVGAAGLDTTLPLHVSAGPLKLRHIQIAIAAEDGALTAEASLTAAITLGPLTLALERLGLLLKARAEPGNVGPFDLHTAFKPPTGAEVTIETGEVTGSGFLSFDPARGRYSGVLQLSIGGIDVSAIGVLDTKDAEGNDLPDPGFSFLIILFADIPPVQIGFGFRLTSVGGLMGIYRDSNYELLKAGLTAGALDSVMFPPDPVANADQLMRDLTMLFPQKAGRHIIGPMLRLEWGSPTLVRIEVGILIVSGGPVPVQILGQLATELPSADEALIKLNIDVVGEANFAAGTLTVDAALRDSTVVGFPLTGEAAVRARWKTSPTFGLAFGGFHPDYRPEASFPDLKPLALTISNGSNLRLVAESYLAVTSNSLQFGARAELYAEAAGFSVEGYLEMHMLIIVSPFSFAAAVAFDVSLKFKGRSFASIGLAFDLSGPLPWRAKGKLKIKIAFVTFNLSFNISWGSSVQPVLPPRPVWPELQQALANMENWASILPPESKRDVLVLPRKDQDAVILHPHGVLEVRQRVAPFDLELQRFGSGAPQGDARFLSPTLTVGGVAVSGVSSVEEDFAPGQFLDLTEDEKLSRPSFERMPAGIRFGSTAVRAGNARSFRVEHETRIVGPEGPPRRPGPLDLFAEFAADSRLFRLSLGERARNTVAAESRYRNQGRNPAVSLKPERYLVAEDATATTGPDTSSSIAIASQAIRRSMSSLRLDERRLLPVGLSEFS